ncbi:fatty acid desaturase [Bacteriovorax sp. Seq25_V]|uniref:fatty acid desaturase n=1 Tax=Bacteriovorax sp. Seq25_V TaxID=1201288 RepID=UPI000389EF99|nr:fatty acid desaturase [Bacteriovorax sp. Seq25_V]EQC43811.1 stearoyl-CoA 9-desaturase [Bacteriovorax sp. Seq25_V]
MKVYHDVQVIWDLTSEFKKVNPLRFYFTLIHCALIGWGCFLIAGYTDGYLMWINYLISLVFIYKGTLMIHEVAHFQRKVKGLRTTYNILFGFMNNYPAYLYDTHAFHHGRNTFSTKKDPEYQYVKPDNFLTIIAPIFASVFLPFFQIIRFTIIPIVYLFTGKKFRKYIYTNFSTLVFDLKYQRPLKNDKDLNQMVRNDLMCSLTTIIGLALILTGLLPMKLIPMWFGMVFTASLLNMYRAKFNHVYNNKERASLSWEDHLLDCITVDRGIFTEIWSPVGLRYHTLHHVMQEIPFHNLKKAHEHLMANLPADHIYRQTVVPNFMGAIKRRNAVAV